MKRLNPYQRLLNEIKDWCLKIKFRRRKTMFSIPKTRIGVGSFSLSDVYERTLAAEQLGYEVHVESHSGGLVFIYVEKMPDTPWNWRS